MASPLGDQAESKFPDSIYQSIRSQFQDDLAAYLDVQQLFILIDGVLPFEACLYYQVLPLYVDSNRLILGMVNSNDATAMDYVRRIISYHNYRPVSYTISSEALQTVLSAYLNHSGSQTLHQGGSSSQNVRSPRGSARSRSKQQIDHNAQATYIVDSPDDLNPELPEGFLTALPSTASSAQPSLPLAERSTFPAADVPDDGVPATPLPLEQGQLNSLNLDLDSDSLQPIDTVAPLLETNVQRQADAQPVENPQRDAQHPSLNPVLDSASESISSQIPQISEAPLGLLHPVPPLNVQLNHLNQPVEVLSNLPPAQFLQELLGRVLVGGIGRLYFERQPRCGRLLWSQDGVLQSVFERLDLQQFQGIINELKLLAQLSLVPITQSRQVETERLYEGTRILLRFRFIPTESGEEATVQILRGAALKFYQQQQVLSLERDALSIARQLQTKLNEIRDRARSESGAADMRLEVLPALSQILKNIEDQVDHMQPPSDHPPSN